MPEEKKTEETERKERIIEMSSALRKIIEKNLFDNGKEIGYYIEGNSEIIQRHEALGIFISGVMEGLGRIDEENLSVLLRGVAEHIKGIE